MTPISVRVTVYRRPRREYIADMPCRSCPFLSRFAALLVCVVWTLPLPACRKPDRPPPEAKRPVIKSRSELAQQRQAGIRSGRIRPTTRPVLVESERRAAEARLPFEGVIRHTSMRDILRQGRVKNYAVAQVVWSERVSEDA